MVVMKKEKAFFEGVDSLWTTPFLFLNRKKS